MPTRFRLSAATSWTTEAGPGGTPLLFLGLLFWAFLLLPFAALLLHISWPALAREFSPVGLSPLAVSLLATAAATLVIVLAGTPLAWLLARGPGGVGRVVEALLVIPLLTPPLVIGLLLVYLYGPYSFLGHLLALVRVSATNTLWAVILAEIYEAAPYYIFAAQAAFSQVDPTVEQASLFLGVPPWHTWRRVTLPLAAPGLAVALSMAWARAIGAFGAVIVVAYYPHGLPVATWVALQEQGLPQALPLALLLILVALPFPLFTLWWRWRNRVPHQP
ncbi:MAG: ABC transporter permease subunit [Thermaerobacter sp.]|jgi:molybdate/tungstate transport system permease protein|nr:ABC transporter permease subunit [Thermaerobacter sp.]MDA8145829.1 ABC transporter permease subunit [Thermaerobacter sp.]